MIELTDSSCKLSRSPQASPLPVVNPETKETAAGRVGPMTKMKATICLALLFLLVPVVQAGVRTKDVTDFQGVAASNSTVLAW